MLTLNQLTAGLKDAGARYAELNQFFLRFHASAATQLSDQAIPVAGAGPTPVEHNAFDLGFAGRTLRFSFQALAPNDSTLRGIISCHLVTPDAPAHSRLLHRFQFNETGETDLANPDTSRSKLNIGQHADAFHLVLHCLHLSLAQPGE